MDVKEMLLQPQKIRPEKETGNNVNCGRLIGNLNIIKLVSKPYFQIPEQDCFPS